MWVHRDRCCVHVPASPARRHAPKEQGTFGSNAPIVAIGATGPRRPAHLVSKVAVVTVGAIGAPSFMHPWIGRGPSMRSAHAVCTSVAKGATARRSAAPAGVSACSAGPVGGSSTSWVPGELSPFLHRHGVLAGCLPGTRRHASDALTLQRSTGSWRILLSPIDCRSAWRIAPRRLHL